jgi:hypothetical protein
MPAMEKIAKDFKDGGVVFYMLYTREPHPGQDRGEFNFSDKKQTKTAKERVDYALEMMKEYSQERPILIDKFGEEPLQKTIGGNRPNSLIVVDREGKVALWQDWSEPAALHKKLCEMTGLNPPAPKPVAPPTRQRPTSPGTPTEKSE